MTPFLLAIALHAFMQAAPAPGNDPAVLGQWESAVRNKGGVGNTLEFRADGKVAQISGMMSDATWALESDWLRTVYTNEESGKLQESAVRVEFQGLDVFVEKDENGSDQSYSERIGNAVPGASPLVGEWCSLFLDTLTSYRQFTAGGQMFVRLPVTTLRGTWQADGTTLSVHIDGQPPGRYPYRVENGQLIIKSRDGSDRVYKRSPSTLLESY
jgi:hypothetical protein